MSYYYYIEYISRFVNGLPITSSILAKITLATRRAAAYRRKLEEIAQAYATSAKATATKGRIKRNKNTGIYTNGTGLLANKHEDNAYNRAYKPPTNIEDKGSSKDDSKEEEEDNSNNNRTGNSTSNSKDKARYKLSNSSLYYKGRFSYYILPILFLPIIYTCSSSSNNNSSSSSNSNSDSSSSISSTSSNK
ncbi:hypothetical protein P8C59_000133 [Phyllachora maydis]|uniref:Uncharacterized protein n=1 Tax=Phyllachora maydis TaxID=1825666 RepID=A0AAD9HV89_9PEZI|nr:hypothetical protein P8C59_000133 [Phyllachora maydis]